MFFLIDYDRPSGHLVRVESFATAERERAADARLELELALHRDGVIDREVVILEAANEQALRRTHRRYFEDLEGIAASMSGGPGHG